MADSSHADLRGHPAQVPAIVEVTAPGVSVGGMRVVSTSPSTSRLPSRANERFLRELTPEMRRQVLALPRVLAEHRDCYVIFTARKSVCIADALRRLGYWRGEGDYVSNRALDGDLSVLNGRDVLVVEDLAASCRTLATAIAAARSAHASSVRCFALAVEGPRNAWEDLLDVKFVSPYLDSNIDASARHSRSIVDALGALPRPYNIDWPVHAYETEITLERAAAFGWRRLPSLEHYGAASFEPTREILDAIRQVLPAELFEVVHAAHLTKVRLYSVRGAQHPGTRTFVVPIIALGALDEDVTRACLNAVSDATGTARIENVGLRESYRLLQFVLGDVLLALFARSLHLEPPPTDGDEASFLFMPEVRAWAQSVQARISQWAPSVDWPAAFTSSPVDVMPWEGLDEAQRRARLADNALSETFLARYVESREYHLRRQLRTAPTTERARIAREIWDVERPADGASFTAGELLERLSSHSESAIDPDLGRELVSTFLDRAVDAGEVVPEVDVVDGTANRRFRPGEIINFERDTQAQVEEMLRCYRRNTRVETMSQDLVQKLIVGFVQHLIVRQQLVDQAPSGPSHRDVTRLQRRYHLRGAVLDDVDPDFVAEKKVPEVTRQLLAADIIEGVPGKGYALTRPDQDPDPTTNTVEATQFGVVLAEVMTLKDDNDNRLVDIDDLSRLITLSGSTERALALGADLAIAAKRLTGGAYDLRALKAKPYRSALNQGLAKAAWIERNRSAALLKRIRRGLPPVDDLRASARQSVLATLEPSLTGESDARRAASALAQWFRCAHLWTTCVRARAVPAGPDRDAFVQRALKNRAFVALGGSSPRPTSRLRPHPEARRLMLAAVAGADFDSAEMSRLIDATHRELADRAEQLRADCYDINSRALAGPSRSAPIGTCMLVRTESDACDGLHEVPGIGAVLFPTNQTGERLLGGFSLLVEITPRFNLSTHGRQLIEVLGEASRQSVLIDHMPRRFACYRDAAQQRANVSHGFVELANLASVARSPESAISVLTPHGSTTTTGATARAAGDLAATDDLLGCVWQRWTYSAAVGDQLPLVPDSPAAIESAGGITVYGGMQVAKYDMRGANIGAAGDGVVAGSISVNAPLNVGGQAVDPNALAAELDMLAKRLGGAGAEPGYEEVDATEIQDAQVLVVEAAEAVRAGEAESAEHALAKVRPWLQRFCVSVGAALTAAIIKAQLGL